METNEILQELNELESPLAGMPRGMPYAVPEGYFDGMTANALHAVKKIDLPEGYFAALPAAMLEAAKSANKSATPRVARKGVRIIALPVRRWAAAAVLLICLGAGAGLIFRSGPAQEVRPLAALPTEAVNAYAEANLSDLDAALLDGTVASLEAPDLTGFSAEELEAYLAETGWVE